MNVMQMSEALTVEEFVLTTPAEMAQWNQHFLHFFSNPDGR